MEQQQMMNKRSSLSVMMLPWLAHGHVSPFLELAKSLARATQNITVYFCSTSINLSSINLDTSINIQLVELHLPCLSPELQSTKHLPPNLMPLLKKCFDRSEPEFRRLLLKLSPDILLYDFIQPWAADTARQLGIPAVQFLTTGAAATSFVYHVLRRPARQFPFPALRLDEPSSTVTAEQMAEMLNNKIANGMSDADRMLQCIDRSSSFIAVRSLREVESGYIEYLSLITGKDVVPVGPLIPVDDGVNDNDNRFTEWLSAKEESSVVFISFGSEYFMSEDETEEIARGLVLSGVSFIWVIRSPKDGREEQSVRLKRLDLDEDRGMLVEGWAPQRKILSHRSVGGFLTHCGWGSMMEAMWFGVPMIALPLQIDQPLNAKLAAEIGVGVEVKRKSGGGFGREEIAKGVRDVMVSEEGEHVRRKVRELGKKMATKGDEEIQLLLEKMNALCGKGAEII